MGRTLKIHLTDFQKQELNTGFRNGSNHSFRERCRMVLLKSEGLTTKEICNFVTVKSQGQINRWIKIYLTDYPKSGLAVLRNAEGQGRKPLFNSDTQTERIKELVKQERQKLSAAKAILEKEIGKPFHIRTLQLFLKSLSAAIDDLDGM